MEVKPISDIKPSLLSKFDCGVEELNIYLKRFTFSLLRPMEGIVNYFNYRITNGKAEGINNKIKTFKRQAYGYRYIEYFKLRIYHMHKQKHRLVG